MEVGITPPPKSANFTVSRTCTLSSVIGSGVIRYFGDHRSTLPSFRFTRSCCAADFNLLGEKRDISRKKFQRQKNAPKNAFISRGWEPMTRWIQRIVFLMRRVQDAGDTRAHRLSHKTEMSSVGAFKCEKVWCQKEEVGVNVFGDVGGQMLLNWQFICYIRLGSMGLQSDVFDLPATGTSAMQRTQYTSRA